MRLNLYGLTIALGILAAVLYMSKEARRTSLPNDIAMDAVLWAIPPAILFSRLYYVAFTWERYRYDLSGIFRIWEGGLAIYGGIIGGALGILLLSRRRKIPYSALADLIAPGLILAQAIGRWGNFFNGEAFGRLVVDPAWQFFPAAVLTNGEWHMAAFFYESLWNLLGFLFLIRLKERFRRMGNGYIFLWYLVWYGLGRMVIEGLRTDSLMLGSLRVSQLLSVVLVTLPGMLMVFRLKLSPFLFLPCFGALIFLLFGALSHLWAVVPGFVLLFLFAALLLHAFLKNNQALEKR